MLRVWTGFFIALALLFAQRANGDVQLSDGSTLVALWPELPPAPQAATEAGSGEVLDERGPVDESGGFVKHDRTIGHVTRPSLTVTMPPKARDEKSPRPAIIICPGGGYVRLAIDKEGVDIARWFNDRGFVAALLKYRMPTTMPSTAPDEQKPLPIQDVQRAIQIIRERAGEWNVDPKKVGVIGFSAGGHVASSAITQFGDAETRPDFAILMYPVVSMRADLAHPGSRRALLGEAPTQTMEDRYSAQLNLKADTPPTFIVHAKDDRVVKVQNSIELAEAMKRGGVPHELLLVDTGGHGFGLATKGDAAVWPAKCEEWLRKIAVMR